MTTVSPFARSSAFEEPRLTSREQTVRVKIRTHVSHFQTETYVFRQIEEMYSVPESFLEIEVRNPQTHGALCFFYRIESFRLINHVCDSRIRP